MEGAGVPVIDFAAFASAEVPGPGCAFVPTAEQGALAAELRAALTAHGFVYASGLLPTADVLSAHAAGRLLFDEATDRSRLQRLQPGTNTGYGGPGSEALNARRAPDEKEVFNVRAQGLSEGSGLLDGTPEGFGELARAAWSACSGAAVKALLAFGVALGLDDPALFARSLQSWDMSTLRFLHYPEQLEKAGHEAASGGDETGALPCGEHTDFGAVTVLLLEAGSPGLQARKPGGGWMPVSGVDGTVLLNTGAMIARWCNNVVKATPHRVVLTPAERYSVAFFCDPDSQQIIKPLPEFSAADDADCQYQPITSGDYISQCLDGTLLGKVSKEAAISLPV